MEMKGNESNEQPSGILIRSRVPQTLSLLTLLTLWGGVLIRCWHYMKTRQTKQQRQVRWIQVALTITRTRPAFQSLARPESSTT